MARYLDIHPVDPQRRLIDQVVTILRDDGLSYGDYVEQLTFLLFLKMADEQSQPPFNKPSPVPKEFAWPTPLNPRARRWARMT